MTVRFLLKLPIRVGGLLVVMLSTQMACSTPPSTPPAVVGNSPTPSAAGTATLPPAAAATQAPTMTATMPPTTTPTSAPTFTSTPVTVPMTTPVAAPPVQGAGRDPVIAAAGDIACDPATPGFNGGKGNATSCHMLAVANLIASLNPDAVLTLGDTQYFCGGYEAFAQSYDQSWGRFKGITFPVVGNHEYLTSPEDKVGTGCNEGNAGAAGYYKYFGRRAGEPGKGYYSFDLGAWHLVALNSNCRDAGGCGAGSPQEKWLAADLAAHPAKCTLAYYHIPLWSSGGRANAGTAALVQDLYNKDADLVLTGHDHLYERFAPQDPGSKPDPARGLRAFVVGTGGANHTQFADIMPNSEVRNDNTFGVLKVTLHAASYDWQFIPEPGKTFTDSGTQACH